MELRVTLDLTQTELLTQTGLLLGDAASCGGAFTDWRDLPDALIVTNQLGDVDRFSLTRSNKGGCDYETSSGDVIEIFVSVK